MLKDFEERIELIRDNLNTGDKAGKSFNDIFASKIEHLRNNYLTRDEQIHLIRSNTKSSVLKWNVWYDSMFVKDIEGKHYNSDFVHQILSLFLIQLEDADFSHCNLQGIILKYANLKGCDFSYSDLSHSDLSLSNLVRVRFNHTNLQFSNLTCSSMENTDLSYSDLRNNDSFVSITNKSSIKLFRAKFDSRLVFFDSSSVSYVLEKSDSKSNNKTNDKSNSKADNKFNNGSKVEFISYNF